MLLLAALPSDGFWGDTAGAARGAPHEGPSLHGAGLPVPARAQLHLPPVWGAAQLLDIESMLGRGAGRGKDGSLVRTRVWTSEEAAEG